MPIYQGFCGPSNPTQSVMADVERTVNFYPERVEADAAPTGAALLPTPGQTPFATVTDVGTRGFLSEVNGQSFAVVGGGFYELFANGPPIRRGAVAQDNNPATLSYNGLQGGHIFITSGGNGYCYVLSTKVLSTVLAGEATMGAMKDSRFLAFNILNGKVRMSALNDGTTWDPTLFFQRSIAPDPWQAMLVDGQQIRLVGEQTSESWYNTGAFPQPFAPILSSFMPYGTGAPFSVRLAGGMLIWVLQRGTGVGPIMGARGYNPQPISNAAVDTAIARYGRAGSIANTETLVYEEDGHLFANISFPTANATWTVDLGTGAWHERGTWNPAQNRFDAWHPRVHGYAFGKHLVGERGTAVISQLSNAFGSEADGGPIRRLRMGPPLWANTTTRLIVSRLQLMVDTGLGLTTGQGSAPAMMLRTSGNGKTWGQERQCGAGPIGDYGRPVYWTRCGSSEKLWVPEVTVTDPVPFRIAGAEIDGSGFGQLARAS